MPRPAALIGRFQPPHRGHLSLMRRALAVHDELVIVLGSARSARTLRNPLSDAERTELIRAMLRAEGYELSRLRFELVPDVFYNLPLWTELVRRAVGHPDAWLAGFGKDASSFYLKLFPGWQPLAPEVVSAVSGTAIRAALLRGDWTQIGPDVTPAVLAGLQAFVQTAAFSELRADQDATLHLAQAEPIRSAAALIVCHDQLLLAARQERPGLGLWSLPEAATLPEAIRRVLDTEFSSSPLRSRLLDAPQRVPGLNWQTRATLLRLTAPLPARPGARWWPRSVLDEAPETFFADHAQGIRALLDDWPGNER